MKLRCVCVLLVLLAGCTGERPTSTTDAPDGGAARVGQRLYEENLIADPAVNARIGEAVVAVDRDGAHPDSVLSEVHGWLERWVAANPDRAARAHLLPRLNPVPEYADGREPAGKEAARPEQ